MGFRGSDLRFGVSGLGFMGLGGIRVFFVLGLGLFLSVFRFLYGFRLELFLSARALKARYLP